MTTDIQVLGPKVADIHLPDTPDGRREAHFLDCALGTTIAFCGEYGEFVLPAGGREPRLCNNRDVRWMDGRNKCRRCPAGFLHESMMGLIPEAEINPAFVETLNRGRATLAELEADLEAEQRRHFEKRYF